jgi:sugar phosphate isomerase/epimerase
MRIRDIGLGCDPPFLDHRLATLERMLAEFAGFGYHLVELDVAFLGVVLDGRLRQAQVERVAGVLRQFELRYSVHGLERLNLAYDPRRELTAAVMRAQIEFCRRIGASTLVIHSGLQALDDARRGVRRSLLTDTELAAGAAAEVAALRGLGPVAADAGVTIGVENGDPHLWEYNVLHQFALGPEALPKHHARLLIPAVVRQLEQVGHPNVGLTLDLAHLFLAANALGFDYLQAVDQAAPWVRHLHVNDNFGRLDRGVDQERDRLALGEADLHLPPGWGAIPLAEAFARLPDYAGDLILEIKPGFYDDLPEALATTRDLVAAVHG